jgi:polysaccharide export outer membrane protein
VRNVSWSGALAAVALVLLLVALPVLVGPVAESAPQPIAGYRVGPRDLVDIKVFEEPALDGQYRVSESGTIRLPLIGEFPVGGQTEGELTASLKQHLEASYLQRASVTVEIREFLSRPISVIGAVANPGNLDLSGRYTLILAITAAGGLAENHGDTVYVRRRAENGLTAQIAIGLDDLMLGNDPRLDIPIFANDVINIPATASITVYLLGEVQTQGALEFADTERVTLLTAISRAGGLSERAADRIVVRRRERDGSTREIAVDYKRIVNGRDADLELADGDVVVVKESFF